MPEFPIYLKYSHGRTFFKVLGPDAWEELNLLDSTYSLTHFQATILPERNYLADLIANENGHWEESTAEEFDAVLKDAEETKRKMG